jgi:hypothetical protein
MLIAFSTFRVPKFFHVFSVFFSIFDNNIISIFSIFSIFFSILSGAETFSCFSGGNSVDFGAESIAVASQEACRQSDDWFRKGPTGLTGPCFA